MQTTIYNYRTFVSIIDPKVLVDTFSRLLKEAGYTAVNFTEHHFSPHGYTCLWLLSESHLALHTFPETQKTYVELSGCREEMNVKFIELLQALGVIVAEEKSGSSH